MVSSSTSSCAVFVVLLYAVVCGTCRHYLSMPCVRVNARVCPSHQQSIRLKRTHPTTLNFFLKTTAHHHHQQSSHQSRRDRNGCATINPSIAITPIVPSSVRPSNTIATSPHPYGTYKCPSLLRSVFESVEQGRKKPPLACMDLPTWISYVDRSYHHR